MSLEAPRYPSTWKLQFSASATDYNHTAWLLLQDNKKHGYKIIFSMFLTSRNLGARHREGMRSKEKKKGGQHRSQMSAHARKNIRSTALNDFRPSAFSVGISNES